MKQFLFAVLAVLCLFPSIGISQPKPLPVDPHLQLSEKSRIALQNFWRDTGDDRIKEMTEMFAFESLKTQPAENGKGMTRLVPGEQSSGKEFFEVVLVLDQDCELSAFWKGICKKVRGAYVINGQRPMLVVRDVPMKDVWRALILARAMATLGETSDFKCPAGTTAEEARRLEKAAKDAIADQLYKELFDTATAKGLLK